jgi:excinuclease ABC subunit C
MREMLHRRFTRLLEEQSRPAEGRNRRFSYPPALIVVDGGRGQLSQATYVLAELGLAIPHIGLAKRLEEVYFPDRPDPLLIPRGSEALFVLQHIRDEAHRTAVAYHRTLREKRALRSPLDDIPGVGQARKQALMKRFGSLTKLRAASVDEIAATKGVGPALAATIHEHLHEPVRREATA